MPHNASSHVRRTVALCVVIALFTACGEEGDDTDVLRRALPPELDATRLIADGAPEQIALFEDGVIDFADLERATLNYLTCVQDLGFVLGSEPVYDEARLRFNYSLVPPGGRVNDDALMEQERCAIKHLVFVGDTWELQHQATASEKEAALELLSECLRDAGENHLADTIDEDQLPSLLQESGTGNIVARCVTQVVIETGVRLG